MPILSLFSLRCLLFNGKHNLNKNVNQREELASNLVYGDRECGLHFGINLFWGEVTGQESSAQHTVETAAAGQRLHCLLGDGAGQREYCEKRSVTEVDADVTSG